jgi:hypothetical protein
MCGVWHNGANHFVVFYTCPEFWIIIDPLHSVTTPNPSIASSIATSLITTYLHHNFPVSPLPSFRRINHDAIQNDFPQAPWSCGIIAILTALHLPLGHIRPDNINTAGISKRQYLTSTNPSYIGSYYMRSRASTNAPQKDLL